MRKFAALCFHFLINHGKQYQAHQLVSGSWPNSPKRREMTAKCGYSPSSMFRVRRIAKDVTGLLCDVTGWQCDPTVTHLWPNCDPSVTHLWPMQRSWICWSELTPTAEGPHQIPGWLWGNGGAQDHITKGSVFSQAEFIASLNIAPDAISCYFVPV